MEKKNPIKEVYQKEEHFCHFYLEKEYRAQANVAGTDYGFMCPRLAYITKGECTVILPDGQSLEVKEGSVWYIPKNKPYKSVWRTNDYIEFYAIEFDADFYSDKYLTFQTVENTNTLELFEKLFACKKNNDTIATISTFYTILEVIFPLLKEEKTAKTEQISKALNYLVENYTAKISVEDLAKMCYMSQSKFYQTFKNVMKISPIEFKNSIKLSHAVNFLISGKSLEEICERLNFASPAFLRRLIKKRYNKTPKEIKKEKILL